MAELDELRLAYAECSRQKNELLTKYKHLSAEVKTLQKLVAKFNAHEGAEGWSDDLKADLAAYHRSKEKNHV